MAQLPVHVSMLENRRHSSLSRDIELELDQHSPHSHSFDEATVRRPLLSRHSSTSKSFSDAIRVPDADKHARVAGGTHGWVIFVAVIPFIAHFMLAICIVLFLRLYVHSRAFNVQQRRPVYIEADGSASQMPRSALLQSDITTLLSLSVGILRAFAGAWCVATSWRCAMILFETEGMTLGQFRRMLSFGLPSVLWSRKVGCGQGVEHTEAQSFSS
jgi:hypothetical protein